MERSFEFVNNDLKVDFINRINFVEQLCDHCMQLQLAVLPMHASRLAHAATADNHIMMKFLAALCKLAGLSRPYVPGAHLAMNTGYQAGDSTR